MNIAPVDPRDTRWEVPTPVYRVYFWHRPGPPPGIPQESMGWHSEEWRLEGAEGVEQVLAWARETAGGDRLCTVYVEVHDNEAGPGLVHLAGTDPTAA